MSEEFQIQKSKGSTGWSTFFVFCSLFSTSFGVPDVMAKLPIQYLLKGSLAATPETMAFFFACIGVAWYVKPVLAIFLDWLSEFARRYVVCLVAGVCVSSLSWLFMPLASRNFYSFLVVSITLNFGVVFVSTVMGGILVTRSKEVSATGRFSAARLIVMGLAAVIGALCGGVLTKWPFYVTSCLGAAFSIVSIALIPSGYYLGVSSRRVVGEGQVRLNVLSQWRAMIGNFGIVLLLLTSVALAPGFDTVLFFHQTNQLMFTASQIAMLRALLGIGGLLGALIYGILCRSNVLKFNLILGLIIHILTTLAFLFYSNLGSAEPISFLYGLSFGFLIVALFDLSARASPMGFETSAYALMAGTLNLSQAISDVVGSWLFHSIGTSFSALIVVNAIATLPAFVLCAFLPDGLLRMSE